MFTGIVRHVGKVVSLEADCAGGARVAVRCPAGFLDSCGIGDSVCVDGCCLTLAAKDGPDVARFDMSPETTSRTAPLRVGGPVHLEGSLRMGDQLGGHMVYGHVDGTATVARVESEGRCMGATLRVPPGLDLRLVVEKGSVAIAGVSLTITRTMGGVFEVSLVPKSLEATHFASGKTMAEGRLLNFEADYMARYAVGAHC